MSYSKLTNRENEVFSLLMEGYISKEIASKLNISVNTVSNHRASILRKFSAHNTMEAVAKAQINN